MMLINDMPMSGLTNREMATLSRIGTKNSEARMIDDHTPAAVALEIEERNRAVPVSADELAELRRDASRYRWLRDQGCAIGTNDAVHWFRDACLDAAIVTAMQS
jgi:hypothetical protein